MPKALTGNQDRDAGASGQTPRLQPGNQNNNLSISSDRGLLKPACILHRREYGDTSLLVEVWSPELGRLPAIAKGARSGKSGRAALLQPFQPLWVGLTGRGEVRTLTRVEAAGPALLSGGKVLYAGFYLNELLLRLIPREDPQPRLFDHYLEALEGLAGGMDMAACLRTFELRLLRVLGYAPLLERDTAGSPIQAAAFYGYDPQRGPLPAPTSGLRIEGATLLALAADQPLKGARARQARDLMRLILDTHLGGRPLRSRELLREMLRITPPRNPAP